MNESPSSIATISDRISVIQARLAGRPPMSESAIDSTKSPTAKNDPSASELTFSTMVDRLVSQSASGSDTTAAVNDLISQILEQGTVPVGTRSAPVTTVTDADGQSFGATSSANGEQIVDLAKNYLGIPYVWGGENTSGFDCSGLIQHVFGQVGIDLPRVSKDQARVGVEVPNLASAVPGDLVAFGDPVDHIGIYAGNGNMVVAPRTGDVVKVQQITREPVTIRRIVAADAVPTTMIGESAGGDPSDPASQFRPLFRAAAEKYGVPADLLEAVARQESQFDPAAVSPAGAQGLMQLMPATARALGVDAFEPPAAVDGAARLLSQHLRTFDSVPLALAAYNAGAGAVQKFGGIPPYRETQGYVTKIMADLSNGSRRAITADDIAASATVLDGVAPTSPSANGLAALAHD